MIVRGWSDPQKGVEVRPSGYANEVTINYNGLLPKSGADQVFLHLGTGNSSYWSSVNTQKMERSTTGFEKTVRLTDNQVNFCFKDSAANWDNNDGVNWAIR